MQRSLERHIEYRYHLEYKCIAGCVVLGGVLRRWKNVARATAISMHLGMDCAVGGEVRGEMGSFISELDF